MGYMVRGMNANAIVDDEIMATETEEQHIERLQLSDEEKIELELE